MVVVIIGVSKMVDIFVLVYQRKTIAVITNLKFQRNRDDDVFERLLNIDFDPSFVAIVLIDSNTNVDPKFSHPSTIVAILVSAR
jgi:hypothetical protein